ncbi:hypothetical protein POTOM_036529 [Populus tomentosa]|uniref:Uncharacterized protein n=1 Tax=Populus tomentosa TaxID=118781 RepID=A0A8X7ZAU3_POPTO|nr:hypothetical protein POTOM_036529 [Populus tomentosa]
MAEVLRMAIDGEDESKPNGQDQPKKTLKRKRATLTPKQQQQLLNIMGEQKGAKIEELKREMKGLFGYYKETTSQKMGFGFGVDLSGNECSNVNSMVGLLMEESGMSFTKLVEEIYKKLVKMSGNLTVAVVKNAVLLVGQRVMYGVPNVDADNLEDETHSRLCKESKRIAEAITQLMDCALSSNDNITADDIRRSHLSPAKKGLGRQWRRVLCGKPALISTVPSLCPMHCQEAERLAARALKKAGLGVSSLKENVSEITSRRIKFPKALDFNVYASELLMKDKNLCLWFSSKPPLHTLNYKVNQVIDRVVNFLSSSFQDGAASCLSFACNNLLRVDTQLKPVQAPKYEAVNGFCHRQ